MVFAPDVVEALGAAAELVNSAIEPDSLTTIEQLQALFDDWGYTGSRPRTSRELEAVRAVRPRLRELLVADRDTAVELINAILAEQQAIPQLVRHASSALRTRRATPPSDRRFGWLHSPRQLFDPET